MDSSMKAVSYLDDAVAFMARKGTHLMQHRH